MSMKKFGAILLAAAMTLSLAACGNTNDDANRQSSSTPSETNVSTPAVTPDESEPASAAQPEETPVETVKLNVAYMPNYASLWSVLTAIDQGYFEEEGLEITLWQFQDGPSEIAAMEGGSIDLAYIGHGAHRLCINGSATIFAPSSVHSTDKIVVLTSHGIESMNDLAGKKIAYNAGSSSETSI